MDFGGIGPGAAAHGVGGVDLEQIVARSTEQLVRSAAAVKGVVAVATVERIVAETAFEAVVAAEPGDGIVTVAAGERLVAVGSGDHLAATDADEVAHRQRGRIDAEKGKNVAADGDLGVSAVVADHRLQGRPVGHAQGADIDPVLTHDEIRDGVVAGSRSHHEDIVAGTAGQRIVAGTAIEGIVAGPSGERVVAAAAVEHIVAGAAVEGVVAAVSFERHRAGGCRGVERVAAGVAAGDLDARRRQVERYAGRALHLDGIGTAITGNHVGAVDPQKVVAIAALQVVGSGAAVEGIVARVTEKRIVAEAAVEAVVAAAADQHIVVVATVEHVVADTTVQLIVTGASQEVVVAAAAVQRIVAVATVEGIAAAAAFEGIVAGESFEGVAARTAGKGIGTARSGQVLTGNGPVFPACLKGGGISHAGALARVEADTGT